MYLTLEIFQTPNTRIRQNQSLNKAHLVRQNLLKIYRNRQCLFMRVAYLDLLKELSNPTEQILIDHILPSYLVNRSMGNKSEHLLPQIVNTDIHFSPLNL